jgi:hypothetical protein
MPCASASSDSARATNAADSYSASKAGALRFQALGLFLHLGLEVLVQPLQRLGHAVEARRQRAEFVVGAGVDPRAQVARLHPGQPGLQPGQRVEDEQPGRIQQGNRTADGQCHHHELHGIQDGRQSGQVVLDRRDEGVDADHKGIGLLRLTVRHPVRAKRSTLP